MERGGMGERVGALPLLRLALIHRRSAGSSDRKRSFAFSGRPYRQPDSVESFFNRFKRFCGIATRCAMKAADFRAAAKLVVVRIGGRSF